MYVIMCKCNFFLGRWINLFTQQIFFSICGYNNYYMFIISLQLLKSDVCSHGYIYFNQALSLGD
jgi:hypothetical protein